MRNSLLKRIIALTVVLAIGCDALADEGMWTVNDMDASLLQRLRKAGCLVSPEDIYSPGGGALGNAVVSLDFKCSGALISDSGLLITNHHYAYADLKSISTVSDNYLEDGFAATSMDDEIYLPGKHAYVLQEIIDVTDEVNALIASEQEAGRGAGMRRIAPLMEERYSESTGLHAELGRMWAGEKYCISLYRDYTDVRLVAAPPLCAAAFGGDKDNWSWPQQKCDFALYRIYAAQDGSPSKHSSYNVPLRPSRYFRLSTRGYTQGSFAMVLGYPGHTERYSSSPSIDYDQNLEFPIVSVIRRDEMNIISKWMRKDPSVRLKYSDRYFKLYNGQEMLAGQMACYQEQKVLGKVQGRERKYMKSGDAARIVSDMEYKYLCSKTASRNSIYFRETMPKGTALYTIALKLRNNVSGLNMEKEYEAIDMRVENELFNYCVKAYYENVDSQYWGPFQREVLEQFREGSKVNYSALCRFLWKDGIMTKDDNIYKFFTDMKKSDFSKDIKAAQGTPDVDDLTQDYVRALYRARSAAGELQYPDANSSLRLSFGKVAAYKSADGRMPWQTWSSDILDRENAKEYDFTLKPDWRDAVRTAGSAGMGDVPVNFISDLDITGGNSGSPVLNADGEIIGIAFDGNRESLAGPVLWTEANCRAVALDIRFVLWTLKEYLHLDGILKELSIN